MKLKPPLLDGVTVFRPTNFYVVVATNRPKGLVLIVQHVPTMQVYIYVKRSLQGRLRGLSHLLMRTAPNDLTGMISIMVKKKILFQVFAETLMMRKSTTSKAGAAWWKEHPPHLQSRGGRMKNVSPLHQKWAYSTHVW